MKIGSRSGTAAVTVMVPNSLGPAELLLHYGTEDQKNYYLPRLAKGLEVPCFGLTGPDAGSDAGSIPDFGIVCRAEFEGEQDVLGMHVTWEKRYITLGPVATLLGLAFKLYDPNELLGGKKISALRWHSSPPAQLALILVVVIFHLMLPFRMVPILAKTYSSQ